MARNQEKAQTMLARWLRFKEESVREPIQKRPYLAELCNNLHEAEKWRGQIIKDIRRNTAEIQNAALGEHRIRDINDRINKLLREKVHWERRIKQLGGLGHHSHRDKQGLQNMSIGDHKGYLYFGAAKDLPGVRELLQLQQKQRKNTDGYSETKDRHTGKPKRSRLALSKLINADYYGFGDDDDGQLYAQELKQEMKLRAGKIRQWEKETGLTAPHKLKLMQAQQQKDAQQSDDASDATTHPHSNKRVRGATDMSGGDLMITGFQWAGKRRRLRRTKIGVHIPTQQEIDANILEARKRNLLQKYTNDTDESTNLATQLVDQQKHNVNQNEIVTQSQSQSQSQSQMDDEQSKDNQSTTTEKQSSDE